MSEEQFTVPWTPTEAMWGGLARQIMMWMDFGGRHTPRSLLEHLERTCEEIPSWLREEGEMKHLDHAISKGTRCVLIYRAMLDDRRKELLRQMTALGEEMDAASNPINSREGE